MKLSSFDFTLDDNGIALFKWNMADRSMNVIDQNVMADLAAIADELHANAAIKGAIFASAKDNFAAGADLSMLGGVQAEMRKIAKEQGMEAAQKMLFENNYKLNLVLRKIETCGKPLVAAINGICLGGAFELTLACHYRIAEKSAKVGLPEILVGLFPGGGGTQRVPRLMPAGDALQMLFKGEQIKADKAKSMNLVHEVVAENAVEAAFAVLASGKAPSKAPWDMDGYKLPGGLVYSKQGMMTFPPANAILRRETYNNYPAARAILACVYEGLQVPFDLALKIESRYFTNIVQSPEAKNMIRSLFLSKGELDKGARRPKVDVAKIKKIGVVGAGFMGASIAYVSAMNGLEVVLIDRDQAAADKGKELSHKNASDQIMKGRSTSAAREELLSRITATTDYAALSDCQLVIEAVFEDRKVKDPVIKAIKAASPNAILASNTSTLPITSLAGGDAGFIGIHFFSPVEKMMLVEIIMGEKTGDNALAIALDFVKKLKKTPIVVNDCRGFFANRCVGNYIREGHLMLMEGIPATMIETSAKIAGMPVGPLSLNDEVAVDLAWKVLNATKADLGANAIDPAQEKLLELMVVKHERLGRKNGKGFYTYNGKEKKLWEGLADIPKKMQDGDAVNIEELKQRLLVVQALEAAKTVEEGVITDMREADVGSILGFGFAPFTGGALSYIDTMGVKNFVALADSFVKKHGSRFEACKLLRDMAAKGETFYGRFPTPVAKAA